MTGKGQIYTNNKRKKYKESTKYSTTARREIFRVREAARDRGKLIQKAKSGWKMWGSLSKV